jgi:hypothetical protein
MIFEAPSPPPDALRRAIAAAYRADEGECVAALLARADLGPEAGARIAARAQSLVAAVRAGRQGPAESTHSSRNTSSPARKAWS